MKAGLEERESPLHNGGKTEPRKCSMERQRVAKITAKRATQSGR